MATGKICYFKKPTDGKPAFGFIQDDALPKGDHTQTVFFSVTKVQGDLEPMVGDLVNFEYDNRPMTKSNPSAIRVVIKHPYSPEITTTGGYNATR